MDEHSFLGDEYDEYMHSPETFQTPCVVRLSLLCDGHLVPARGSPGNSPLFLFRHQPGCAVRPFVVIQARLQEKNLRNRNRTLYIPTEACAITATRLPCLKTDLYLVPACSRGRWGHVRPESLAAHGRSRRMHFEKANTTGSLRCRTRCRVLATTDRL